jgi:hypothetical protein
MNNCTYNIHSIERIKSKNFFHINPYSGSITILQSLEKSINDKHLLTISYYCQYNSHIAYTRLHINILDKKRLRNRRNNLYRFSQENYLIIFETSLINQQKKYLINLELINNYYQDKRIRPDAQIIEGKKTSLEVVRERVRSDAFINLEKTQCVETTRHFCNLSIQEKRTVV